MSSWKWRPFCLVFNVLTHHSVDKMAVISQAQNEYKKSAISFYSFVAKFSKMTYHPWILIILWLHYGGVIMVSNHQSHDCLLNRLFGRRSKKTWKLCVTGLCAGNSPGTGEFPAQMASYAENVSIWWHLHVDVEIVAAFLALCDGNPPVTLRFP